MKFLLLSFFINSSYALAEKWDYKDESQWGKISNVCIHGEHQSPINIEKSTPKKSTKEITYSKVETTKIINNGHTIQVNLKEGALLEYQDKKFQLLQIHFHAPSEHHIEDIEYAFEAHFVHSTEKGELAVVGVLFKEGKRNGVLQQILKNASNEVGEKDLAISFDTKNLLPKVRDFYSYKGSLTTPPCSEGVNWIVMSNILEVSKSQIAEFKKLVGLDKSNRSIQPLNERGIKKGSK